MERKNGKKELREGDRRTALQNGEEKITKRLLILAGLCGGVAVWPIWSKWSNGWGPAVSFVSLFLALSFLVAARIFSKRSGKLRSLIAGEKLLASWTMSPRQKADYIRNLYRRELGRNLVIFASIVTIAVPIFGVFILVIDEGKLAMFGVLVGLILFLALVALGAPLYYRAANARGDGKVMIGPKSAYINGYFHNWDFPLSGLSKIRVIHEPYYGLQLVYWYIDRTLKHHEELLIPADEERDLSGLIETMKAENPKRPSRKRSPKRKSGSR